MNKKIRTIILLFALAFSSILLMQDVCQAKTFKSADNNLVIYNKGKKSGYKNNKGKVIVKAGKYKVIQTFDHGLAIVGKKKTKGYLINNKGKVILSGIVSYPIKMSCGRGTIMYPGKKQTIYGLVDKKGKVIIDKSKGYTEIQDFRYNYALVSKTPDTKSKKYGLINKSGKLIIPMQYEYITDYHNGYFLAENYGLKTGNKRTVDVYNKKGKKISTLINYMEPTFGEGNTIIVSNNKHTAEDISFKAVNVYGKTVKDYSPIIRKYLKENPSPIKDDSREEYINGFKMTFSRVEYYAYGYSSGFIKINRKEIYSIGGTNYTQPFEYTSHLNVKTGKTLFGENNYSFDEEHKVAKSSPGNIYNGKYILFHKIEEFGNLRSSMYPDAMAYFDLNGNFLFSKDSDCEAIKNIVVTKKPKKLVYTLGDRFDPTGLVVKNNKLGNKYTLYPADIDYIAGGWFGPQITPGRPFVEIGKKDIIVLDNNGLRVELKHSSSEEHAHFTIEVKAPTTATHGEYEVNNSKGAPYRYGKYTDIIGTLKKGTKIKVTTVEDGEWAKFEYRGKTCYCWFANLVRAGY